MNGAQPVSPFAGRIDELAVYNRALSAAEIQAIYNAGSAGKCRVPFITAQPQGQTATAGSDVTFVVTAGGAPPLSYQWQLNTTNIAGATASSLTLTNVQPGQAGSYRVVVSNALGVVTSSNAMLAVLPPPCATPPAGLVSWWPGEGTAIDIAGTNNGTLVNGVTFAPGEVGQAFSFNGTSSYVRVADNPNLRFTKALTIEAWIYPTSVGGYYNIVSKWDYAVVNAQKSYVTGLLPDGRIGLGICADGDCSVVTGANSTNLVPANQWTHFAGTYDGSNIEMYVNGVCESQTPCTYSAFPGTGDLLIGAASAGGGQVVSPFAGLIDEPSVYSRALSAAEIQAIYNAGSAGKCRVPFITSQPQGQTATAGSDVTFVVTAGGTSPLSYQWQFNTTNIAGATANSLTLTDVQPDQAGNYRVVVSNAWGSVTSSNAALAVLTAPCASPPAGLVAWWPGEGNANDIVGTNNGTLVNGVTFAPGIDGQAFSFDGISSYILIPDNSALHFTNAITIEGWVYPTSLVGYHNVLSKWDWTYLNAQKSYTTDLQADGTIGFGVCNDGSCSQGPGGGSASVSSTNSIPVDQWTHFAATYDASNLRIYVNGVCENKTAYSSGLFPGTNALLIGAGVLNGAQPVSPFAGRIDELAIYNRALTAGEIQAIYNAGSAGKCQVPLITSQPQGQTATVGSTATFMVTAGGIPPLSYQWQFNSTNIAGATANSLTLTNVQPGQAGNYRVVVSNALGVATSSNAVLTVISPTCATPPAGLVSWWPGEGTANDIAGTNNGTLVNGVAFAPGEVGQAFSFNGTSSYIQIADNPNLHFTNAMTVEAWLYLSGLGANQAVVCKWDWTYANAQKAYTTWVQPDGQIGFGVCDDGSCSQGSSGASATVVSTNSLPVNQWTHFAAAYDGSGLSIYVNGVCENQTAYTNGIFPGTGDLRIGSAVPNGGGGVLYPFAGLIDEPSVYNRALSAAEIQAIYNAGSAGKCRVPFITSQPQGQTATAGSTVAFMVTAGGIPPLSYQWQFNSTNIAGATANSLTLTNVQPGQAGNYLVVVSNALGVVTSSNAMLAVFSSPCATPPAGLVAWWPGEGNANDIAGTNNGTLIGGASFVSGEVGQAFSFNGANQCVQIPYAPSLASSNYSVEAWVKPLAQVSDPINQVVIFGQSYGQYQLAARTGSTGIRIAFQFGASPVTFYGVVSTNEIPLGQFTHLAGTWDGSTLRLYINGVLNAQSTPGASPVDSGCPFSIGGFYESCGYVGQFFNGLIDEVSYYNRALSGGEVQAIYLAGGAGKCRLPRVATASAVVVNGFVVGANITDGGYGYTSTPIVKIIGGGGSGAQAVAVVSNGVVIAVNVVDAGSGYTNTPVIVFAPPFTAQPTMTIGAASLLSFTSLAVGTNYQLQFFSGNTWSNLGQGFTAASPTFTQYVTGTAGPNGYRLASTPVSAQAYATAQMINGFVVGATVTSGGSGYGSTVLVSIVGGGGSNATAIATVSGGVVTGLTITDAGIGYTTTPSIIIAPPPANALWPTVTPAVELDLGGLLPYDNYQLEFAPVLGGAWSDVGSLFTPTGTTSTQYINASGNAGFFRVSYVP